MARVDAVVIELDGGAAIQANGTGEWSEAWDSERRGLVQILGSTGGGVLKIQTLGFDGVTAVDITEDGAAVDFALFKNEKGIEPTIGEKFRYVLSGATSPNFHLGIVKMTKGE